MACIMKNKLDNGKISYTIQVKAKDPKTNKYKIIDLINVVSIFFSFFIMIF